MSLIAGGLGTPARSAPPAPGSTPTLPPISATATPSPSGQLVRWAGQLLDVRKGFVFFTTGDGFRLAPAYQIVDAASGGATSLKATTRNYARASFDTGTGQVVELALSRRPLPSDAEYAQIKRFALALSTPVANPDLAPPPGGGLTGKPVLVVFTVEVPVGTPVSDDVFLATDVSGWSATAIKMDRVDARHYRISRDFNSGTRFLYRYTRGSWRSAERGEDGLEHPPHSFIVNNSDVQRKSDVVFHWGDENPSAPDVGAQALPTPFNPRPFVTPRP